MFQQYPCFTKTALVGLLLCPALLCEQFYDVLCWAHCSMLADIACTTAWCQMHLLLLKAALAHCAEHKHMQFAGSVGLVTISPALCPPHTLCWLQQEQQ
jgi:hypothetical protein